MSGQIERNPFYSETKQMSEDAEREMIENCRKDWKMTYKRCVIEIANKEGSLKQERTDLDKHMQKDPDTYVSNFNDLKERLIGHSVSGQPIYEVGKS